MATINGAIAMGIDDSVGSLEAGKSADMIAVKIDPLEHAPLHDLLSHIVYTHNGHRVSHSWVNGKILMNARELTTLNVGEITHNASKWHTRLHNTENQT
jgi:5-methylthioadenosine/S-adenosylhomocysteine deaminase